MIEQRKGLITLGDGDKMEYQCEPEFSYTGAVFSEIDNTPTTPEPTTLSETSPEPTLKEVEEVSAANSFDFSQVPEVRTVSSNRSSDNLFDWYQG